jgi:hypothetical protein
MANAPTPAPSPSPREDEKALPTFGERRPDAMEQLIIDGKATDSEGKLIPADAAKVIVPHILDDKQQESLKGELKTGEVGYVPLDDKGKPSGPATKFPPRDKPAAAVATVIPSTPRVLATPSGAFLTDAGMQPSPHTNKYSSPSYKRDYNAIAKKVAERDGYPFGEELK